VDGMTAGVWRTTTTRKHVVLWIAPLRRLSPAELDDVAAEAGRFLQFLAPHAAHSVSYVDGGWPALLAASA